MSYNVTPGYYPTYQYPQLQNPVGYNSPAVQIPSQQYSIPPTSVPTGTSAASNIQWVQGISGATAFPVGPNETYILMDSDEPVVYKKSADEHGKPLPLDVYDLIKRPASPSSNSTDLKEYVKKSELDSYINDRLEKELDRRVSQLSFKPATRKKRTEEDDED